MALLVFSSCEKDPKGVFTFEDTVEYMESDPRQFLQKLDSSSADEHLDDEDDATVFLLKAMCSNYINETVFPSVSEMEDCVSLLSSTDDVYKYLEGLLFLARTYHNSKDSALEVSTVDKALDFARKHNNKKWIFYLYTYLSELYLKNVDLIRFAEYQSMAKPYYKNLVLKETDIYTKQAIGKSYIYNRRYDDAAAIFSEVSQAIGEKHAYYGYNHLLLGIVYFRKGEWNASIEHLEIAMSKMNRPNALFMCYSILTHCYAPVDNLEKAYAYKQKAIESYHTDETSSLEIEFYKICARLAEKSEDYSEETLFLNKIIEVYDQKLRTLNDKTLSEAMMKYEYNHKEAEYKNKIGIYKYAALFLVFVLLVAAVMYISWKKQHAYKVLLLNEQIGKLKVMSSVSEETKFMIARDIEIARRVSYLKFSKNEKSNKFIEEIEKLNILDGNKLLDLKWDDFFRHIDIVFDGFYTKLMQKFPSLSDKDVQLCCMLLAGFRTEEIASVWRQSIHTVHKTKSNLRKKILPSESGDFVAALKEKIYS